MQVIISINGILRQNLGSICNISFWSNQWICFMEKVEGRGGKGWQWEDKQCRSS